MKTHSTIVSVTGTSCITMLFVGALTTLIWCSLAAAQPECASPTVHSTTPTASAAIPGNKKLPQACSMLAATSNSFSMGAFSQAPRTSRSRMNPPVKMGPVLLPDKPWESADMGFCVSVVDDGGRCKMWYLTEGKDSKGAYHLCYAESKDGVVWEKPNLGLIASNGSIDNNIVMAGTVETTVFLDPVAAPESRYKAIAMMCWPDPKKAGLYVHTSPDGIHWKMSDERVFPVAADTANQAFYDARLKKYVANIRVWAPMRKIGRVEMDDITEPWPVRQLEKPFYIWGNDKIPVASHEVPIVFGYDDQDPAGSDHYNPACVQYPWAERAYFMFPSPYRHFPNPPIGRFGNDGLVDIQMALSRDGANWSRLSRDPYVSLGTEDEADSRQMYMAVGMVRRGKRIFQYYGGCRTSHGEVPSRPGPINRLEQRLDGFVSADAAFESGEFTTPTLAFTGTRLVLNINASAMGTCNVEILDGQGHAFPGFSLADCDEIGGNYVEKTVSWKGKTDLSLLSGRPVRLRFAARACKVFAFQFPN